MELYGSGNKAYYVYNAAGERVRKVITEKYTENGEIKERIVEERYYLGNTEFYSKFANGNLTLKSRTNHIMDDTQRIATINTQLEGDTPLKTTVRYQYANHLGSASLELDETAQIISYQEYHPYGSIAYSLHKNNTDVNLQRYKFTGKERDSETGLDYFGARYYSSDLAIWLSVDPLASKYPSTSPYMYVLGNPIKFIDPNGMNHDVYINGKDAVKATEDLNAGTSLAITRDSKTGKLSATGKAETRNDKKLLKAINDKSVEVHVDADNNSERTYGEGELKVFGGSFMGTSFEKKVSSFSIINEDSKMQEETQIEFTTDYTKANQSVNPNQLEYIEGLFDAKRGEGMLHEVTESYKAALISRKWGIEAKMATKTEPTRWIYLDAHKWASPQPGDGKLNARHRSNYFLYMNTKK